MPTPLQITDDLRPKRVRFDVDSIGEMLMVEAATGHPLFDRSAIDRIEQSEQDHADDA